MKLTLFFLTLFIAVNALGAGAYFKGGHLYLGDQTATTVPYLDASKIVTSSSVTPTELGYVSGVTSAIQTQLNSKTSNALPLAGGTMNSNASITFLGTGHLIFPAGANQTFIQSTEASIYTTSSNTRLTLDSTSRLEFNQNGQQVGEIIGGSTTTSYIYDNSGNHYMGLRVGSSTQRFDASEEWDASVAGTTYFKITSDAKANVLAGTGVQFAGVPGSLKVNTTAVGNGADTSEDVLITYTSPAAILGTNGDRLEIEAFGTFAANTDTKEVKCYYGGTVIFDTTAAILNGGAWSIKARVVRTAAATQIALGEFEGNVAVVTSPTLYTTPAETLSGTVVIKCTGTAGLGNANDIIQKALLVKWFPNN